jgi:TonB family protein
MYRLSPRIKSEKIAIEMGIKQIGLQKTLRSFAVLLISLPAVLALPSFAMTPLMVAQDSNGSAPAQLSDLAVSHGVYKVGGDVSAPVLIHSVEPEARDTTVAGTVQVTLWVDVHGNPSHVRVTHGLGMGLDEKAVETVRQYKYKPAMKSGTPVMVELNVEVKFQRSAN